MRIFEPLFIFLLCGSIGTFLAYSSGKSLYSAKRKLLPGGLSFLFSAVSGTSALFFLDFAFVAPEYNHLYGTGVRILLIVLAFGVSIATGYLHKGFSLLKQECESEPKSAMSEKEK